jgi:5-methylcytosine-specific restriction endonuclease McrA
MKGKRHTTEDKIRILRTDDGGQSLAERLRGVLPQPLPRRVPKPRAALDLERGSSGHRRLSPGLQRPAATQLARLPIAAGLRRPRSFNPSLPSARGLPPPEIDKSQPKPQTQPIAWTNSSGGSKKCIPSGGSCVVCLSTLKLEVGHKIALMNGGTDDFNNLAALCGECHLAKTKIDNSLRRQRQKQR